MKNRRRKVLLLWIVGLLALVSALVCVFDYCRRVTNISFGHNQWMKVVSASRYRFVDDSETTISFYSDARKLAEVQLLQCSYESPIIVIPGEEPNTFFCAYDYDTVDLLLRLDISRPYTPPIVPANLFEPLHNTVKMSTCEIRNVAKDDTKSWTFVAAAIGRMPPKKFEHDSLICTKCPNQHYPQRELLESISQHGGQGQMNGETVTR
jgi:hypothetical protein